MKRLLTLTLACLLLLSACATEPMPSPAEEESLPPPVVIPAPPPAEDGESSESSSPEEPEKREYEGPTASEYVRSVVLDAVSRIDEPGMSEYERVKAAYDYLIGIGYYRLPVALDVWRIRSRDDALLTFVENRSLSLLLYGIGVCEDYSAALILMLDEMDIETRYIPGLTYSLDGDMVHHAWIMARVDDVWYHLDCELEDGISKGTVRYKYFLKGDATMGATHFWGQRLIDMDLLQEDQNEEIAEYYLGETCPRDYPAPAPNSIPVTPRPKEDEIFLELEEELWEFGSTYGLPDYMELNVTPPVFGRYGGYYSNNTPPEDHTMRIYNTIVSKLLIPPEDLEDTPDK